MVIVAWWFWVAGFCSVALCEWTFVCLSGIAACSFAGFAIFGFWISVWFGWWLCVFDGCSDLACNSGGFVISWCGCGFSGGGFWM